jgi:hypothetical protein
MIAVPDGNSPLEGKPWSEGGADPARKRIVDFHATPVGVANETLYRMTPVSEAEPAHQADRDRTPWLNQAR